jgi:single-strand DNA-binding protein
MYLNKAFLYGNLTRDPELKALPSGNQVANFGLATNRTYKGKDGTKQESTEFHNIVAFGRTAEVIGQYCKKGKAIFVEGRIQTRSWEGKEDGKKQYRTEIVVNLPEAEVPRA